MAYVTPRTWGTNETLTAAKMNEISSSIESLGGPWLSYTPTWTAQTTNPVIGNGSLAGAYREAGKQINYRIILNIGSSSTMGTGAWLFTLPVAFHGDYVQHAPMGVATMFDTSASNVYTRFATIFGVGARKVVLRNQDSTAADLNTPILWASGDRIFITGEYETA